MNILWLLLLILRHLNSSEFLWQSNLLICTSQSVTFLINLHLLKRKASTLLTTQTEYFIYWSQNVGNITTKSLPQHSSISVLDKSCPKTITSFIYYFYPEKNSEKNLMPNKVRKLPTQWICSTDYFLAYYEVAQVSRHDRSHKEFQLENWRLDWSVLDS